MSGLVTGGTSRRPGSTDGPPSMFQSESLRCVGPLQSCSIGGRASSSGVPAVVVPGANSWKFHW